MSDKQYSNENRIALFANDKKGNDKRPDMRGSFTLNGVEYKVSVWWCETRDGRAIKYLSGQLEPAGERDARPADTRQTGDKQSLNGNTPPHRPPPDLPYKVAPQTTATATEDVPF